MKNRIEITREYLCQPQQIFSVPSGKDYSCSYYFCSSVLLQDTLLKTQAVLGFKGLRTCYYEKECQIQLHPTRRQFLIAVYNQIVGGLQILFYNLLNLFSG